MRNNFWWKFFSILFLINLIVIGTSSYLTLRTREYQSDIQINFPLWEGWVVEIRTDQTALLTAASSEYFYLQKEGSLGPREVIAAKPSERPVNYEDDTYFLTREQVQSSCWIVQEASSAEGRLERFQEDTDLHVRIYPQPYVVTETILMITFVFLFISFLITGLVWSMT